ncbi:CBO0543 family protein [Bacillus salitolerans]|uniref:CBO0543 family protein n=1 Tax=Bacillus salitolerans TaxID=1437434 RepID=A0ABW4LUI9_9BACI
MSRKKSNLPYYLLMLTTAIGLILLPFAIVKRSFKDWVIVYLVSVIGNYFADLYLVSKGYLKYKKKFSGKLKVHLPFDFIHYPLMLLYYNQWTLNSKPAGILLKLFPFVIPQVLIETIAERKTKLITWRKGWTWVHSFISVVLKLLICRSIIALIRTINKGKISVN